MPQGFPTNYGPAAGTHDQLRPCRSASQPLPDLPKGPQPFPAPPVGPPTTFDIPQGNRPLLALPMGPPTKYGPAEGPPDDFRPCRKAS